MDDWADTGEEQTPKPRRTSGCVWVVVFLFLLWLLVDLFAISLLGTNANETFQTVPAKNSEVAP